MPNKIRIDVALRLWKIAPSRAKAQELIKEGAVEIFNGKQWIAVADESTLVDEANPELIRLIQSEALEYVSRGGRKLAAALTEMRIEVKGLQALDVGISTGGFADCLLRHGAAQVIGVDVGRGQLAEALKSNPLVTVFEGVNARELSSFKSLSAWLGRFDLAVVDVSFVSLRLIFPEVQKFLRPGGAVVALVKPQFEVGPENLDKKGVAKNIEMHRQIEADFRRLACELGLEVKDYRPSAIRGQDGNQEYFLYAIRSN